MITTRSIAEVNSTDYKQNFYMYYGEKRHETGGVPQSTVFEPEPPDWRMRDRLKTVSAILAMCLNIGVEPPSGFKTLPAAKLQCWVDPTGSVPGGNAMGVVTRQLQTQYEQLSMRTRYKVISDPTQEEIKKYAQTIRRNAREERILFHYNGNGVPEPTAAGELWFFNKNYTQYIPVSLYDLQNWLGAPTIFVYDCSQASRVIKNFDRYPDKHLAILNEARRTDPNAQPWNFAECIQLAACGETEHLPTNPLLPADLFTSCLTTPIEMAVRFYILQSPLKKDLQLDDHYRIPGRPQERKTPLGELNWIFTAITDTIAWNMLPRPLFKRLFRQDLMVAALFRNFLLAQRVMRTYHCHPKCHPPIPDTHNHPLWASWDLAIEMVLAQLQFPDMQEAIAQKDEKRIEQIYQHSDFFKDQLTAFEVYLDHGAREQKEPEQLPIVLQVLLSQVHRLRALILLSRFLDLGPWAVRLALGIGIFPYVLKLLQSQAQDLKPPLIFIWARILAVDQSCQADLLKDNGFTYFASILNPVQGLPVRSISEHRAMCAFIIAIFCRKHRLGQQAAQNADLVESCLSYVSFNEENNPALRQWACLCLSTLWEDFSEPKWTAIRLNGHLALCDLVSDPVPEVRAAMLHAMSTFIGVQDMTEEIMRIEEEIALRLLAAAKDSCVIVRKELAVFLSAFCGRYMQKIIVTALEHIRDELQPTLTQLQHEAQSQGNDEVPGSRPINNNKASDSASHPAVIGSTSTGGTHVDFENSPNTSFATAAGHSMSGTTFDSAVTRNSEEYGSRTQENGHRQAFSKDSPYTAVWLHVLMLAIDPDIQVSRGASYVIRTVILTALKMPDFGNFAEDLFSFYGEYMSAADTPSAATTHSHHAPQTPAPAAVPTTPTSEASKADGYLSIGIRRTASVAASLATMAFRSSSALSSIGDSVSPPKPLPRSNTLGRQSTLSGKSFGDLSKTNEDSHRENHYGRADFPYPKWYTKEQAIWPSALPIRSDFFEYATEYFQELRMMNTEEEEPGSRIYNERMWRRNRNEDILDETQRLKDKASKSRWDQQAGYFNNGFQPGAMCFHQYENQIVIADDCDMIRYMVMYSLNMRFANLPLGYGTGRVRNPSRDSRMATRLAVV
jgi:regulator-associated protein of mTOR